MSTPFRAVNFQPNQLLDEATMDQLASNQNWLFNHMPSVVYTYNAITKRDNVRTVVGRALIGASKEPNAIVEVRFGNYFSANCIPIVTTGLVSNAQRKFFVSLDGYGQLMPDSRGFRVHVQLADESVKTSITRNVYVTWNATGY